MPTSKECEQAHLCEYSKVCDADPQKPNYCPMQKFVTLINNQQDMPPEFVDIVDKYFWELF
jgi:hypothetical protein